MYTANSGKLSQAQSKISLQVQAKPKVNQAASEPRPSGSPLSEPVLLNRQIGGLDLMIKSNKASAN